MRLNPIYKHYEKIILAAALIFLVLSLVWLISIFSNISSSYTETIVLRANESPYLSANKEHYRPMANLKNSKVWNNSEKRNSNPDKPDYIITFTDFMIPFKIARSNAPGAKNKLIPYAYYKKGICPISKEPISLKDAIVDQSKFLDTDKDTIPDAIEKKYNMDPKNPKDIYYDNDNDSFSNIEEYLYNQKGISDKSIHPELSRHLALMSISNTRIPLIVKKIIRHGDNQNNWVVQINFIKDNGKWTTKFLKIGEAIKMGDTAYTIMNIQNKIIRTLDPRLGTVIDEDVSKVILSDNLNEQIMAQKDKEVYDPNRKITLKNLYTGQVIYARLNSTITLKNKTSAEEKYKIIAITDDGNSIMLERNNKKYNVTKESGYKVPLKPAIIIENQSSQTQNKGKYDEQKN